MPRKYYTPGRGKMVPRKYYTPGRGKIVPRNYTPGRGKIVPRIMFEYLGLAYRDSDYTAVITIILCTDLNDKSWC